MPRYTPAGVRLRLRSSSAGGLNWLLLPGGPGIGSESSIELAGAMQVPGSIWLVDLPGEGSNISSAESDPYGRRPQRNARMRTSITSTEQAGGRRPFRC
jgi:hypothetical protein